MSFIWPSIVFFCVCAHANRVNDKVLLCFTENTLTGSITKDA